MERAIVFGTGLIGKALVRLLLAPGAYEVHVFARFSRPCDLAGLPGSVRVHRGDINDEGRVREVFSLVRPSLVFIAAGVSDVAEGARDPRGAYNTNVWGSLIVLRAAFDFGARAAVYTSTAHVYGPTDFPAVETSPYGSYSGHYIGSKIAADRAVLRRFAGSPLVCVRPACAIHADDRKPTRLVVAAMAKTLAGEKPQASTTRSKREVIFVDDLAGAMVRLAELRARNELPHTRFNVGSGERFTPVEIVQMLLRLANRDPNDYDLYEPRDRPAEIGDYAIDSTRLHQALPSWSAMPIRNALSQVFDERVAACQNRRKVDEADVEPLWPVSAMLG